MYRLLAFITALLILAVFQSCATAPVPESSSLAEEYHRIAQAYVELKNYEKARLYFARALELDGSLGSAGYNFARALVDQGKFAEAVPLYRSLLSREPDNLLVREALGYSLLMLGEADEARSLYMAVLASGGERVSVLVNLARIEASREGSGLAWLERALVLYPDHLLVQGELLGYFSMSGNYPRAIIHANTYRNLGGKDGKVLAQAALAYEREGYYAQAQAVLDALIEQGIDLQANRFKVFRLKYLYGKDSSALDLLDSLLADGFVAWADVKSLYDVLEEEDRAAFEVLVKNYLASFPVLPEAKAP